MHVSLAEYEAIPALIVDWDLELQRVEQRVEQARAEREQRR